jgi:uncharacterized RDD family membrane protein YckC
VPSYAGFWKRVAASLMDSLVLGPVSAIIASLLTLGKESFYMYESNHYWPIMLLVSWIYCAALESSEHQATLGKLVLGIKVTDLYGKRISFGRATGRHFANIFSGLTLCIGYIMAAFTKQKQCLR